jgi:biopolymer transport protein ExbD
MAELEQKQIGNRTRRKRISTRIDFTPMVDLGFLLVTFFMLTTAFTKPQTMEINLPVIGGEQSVPASKTITIILGAEDRIYWYHGLASEPFEGPNETNFSNDGIRKILSEKKSTIQDLIVLIKPTNKSVYKNVVDILDEMNISNIKKYALVDITKEDLNLINYK